MEWPGTRGSSRQTGRQINHYKRLRISEVLRSLSGGHWAKGKERNNITLPGGERCRKDEVLDDLPWKDKKRNAVTNVSQENTATGSGTITNHKGNAGETAERWGGVHNT